MDNIIRLRNLQRERETLSQYAMLCENTKGRKKIEEECPVRTAYQRDRDRIIHSSAFRRLKDKTQVFLAPDNVHYRTRLTHTLEVSQIARTIARALRLNEDLTEAIAMAHDLGHTPFGHAGERALNDCLNGGFRHYEQSVRVAEKIEKHGLDMKLVNVEYTFDNSKLLFYFTADGRVDFRALVKDLASVFRTRIELRQIGVRDEAKMLGGLGVCGRPFCCSSFMGEFQPVSIKMAKEQGLSLSPVKISGTCGRLMCCLKYEQEAYLDLLKKTPKVGAIVSTPDGKGTVVEQNLLTGMLKVSLDKSQTAVPATYMVKQVKIIKDGQIRLDKSEIEQLKGLEE